MFIRLFSILLTALLTSCAVHQSYSDATNVQERKIYIGCAVTRAFLNPDYDTSTHEVARIAIDQCNVERQVLLLKLIEENIDKPFGMNFVESYMNELHATMLNHIALRLALSRAGGRSRTKI